MAHSGELRRELGIASAVLLGLGSIVGTGVYVSIGIGAAIAGSAVVGAVMLAAVLAVLNGLSSAQLAAAHPVSGGTYEYGYRFVHRRVGFTAGWMFVSAKSASAATAALGFAGYLGDLAGIGARTALAVGAVVLLTGIVLSGIRRSSAVNTFIVVVAVGALLVLAAVAWPEVSATNLRWDSGGGSLLEATALMFVAYTGYGRVATLGEEVRDPGKTIPRAIIATLVVTMIVYVVVAGAAVGVLGAQRLAVVTAETAAPLEAVARAVQPDVLPTAVAVGALVAMLGVILNLLLGLSRVVLAMGRRADLPSIFASVRADGRAPVPATMLVGGTVLALTLIGDVRLTWSFSAFTVLIYYAITNLAALRLPAEQRRFPPVLARAGLAGCLFVALWIDPGVILAGSALIGVGLVWHELARRRSADGLRSAKSR